MNKLYRSRTDKKIAGVCGGLARSYGWDSTVVRLIALLLLLFGGGGFLAYVLCWIVIPEEPVHLPYGTPVSSVPQAAPPVPGGPNQPPPYA